MLDKAFDSNYVLASIVASVECDLVDARDGTYNGTISLNSAPVIGAATLQTVIKMMSRLPAEPIGEYMRLQGLDPANGYVMFIPASKAHDAHMRMTMLPDYVRISSLVTKPFIALVPRIVTWNNTKWINKK